MIKKIKVKDLRIGMFIHDINCKWLRHPFFGNSIKVTSEKIVEKIIKYGIEDVYIDTEIGIDDVDLSKPMGKGGADRILGHESPEKFDIHTGSYI